MYWSTLKLKTFCSTSSTTSLSAKNGTKEGNTTHYMYFALVDKEQYCPSYSTNIDFFFFGRGGGEGGNFKISD